jgi:hypothetical protein
MKIAKIIAVVVALAGLALSSCAADPGPPAPVPNMVMPGK